MQRKNMIYRPVFWCVLLVLFLIACLIRPFDNEEDQSQLTDTQIQMTDTQNQTMDSEEQKMNYQRISQEEAKQIMDSRKDIIILDVRRADEFAEGHIPGAINVANESIGTEEIAELPDKNQTILVYCRSGRRSMEAASKLAALGYTDIREFGGIIDWKYEIVQ